MRRSLSFLYHFAWRKDKTKKRYRQMISRDSFRKICFQMFVDLRISSYICIRIAIADAYVRIEFGAAPAAAILGVHIEMGADTIDS